MKKFAAFLRGINVGGHHKVKMEDLRRVFMDSGFTNVKTILASGNVIFETEESDASALVIKIEAALKQAFGFEIAVIVRSMEEIRKLIDSDPFNGVQVTEKTRLYVTFLGEVSGKELELVNRPDTPDYQVLQVTDGEIISVLTLTPNSGTTESMKTLEKVLGKRFTTRNWNTVLKLAE